MQVRVRRAAQACLRNWASSCDRRQREDVQKAGRGGAWRGEGEGSLHGWPGGTGEAAAH